MQTIAMTMLTTRETFLTQCVFVSSMLQTSVSYNT